MRRTPVGASNYGSIDRSPCGHITGDAKIGQFDGTVFVRQDICTFDIAMDDALVVKVDQSFQDL